MRHASVVDVRSESEPFEMLRERAHKRFGRIPAELIAAQVLRVCDGGDWPVQKAALDALYRRFASARAEGLTIAGRRAKHLPALVRIRAKAGPRPYRVLLESVDPTWGSCDCRDYTRSSLGLCKHLMIALEAAIVAGAMDGDVGKVGVRRGQLSWNPVRPLTGSGDWLERVHLFTAPGARVMPLGMAEWFAPDGRPKSSFAEDPARRAILVATLRRYLRAESDREPIPSHPALRPLLEEEAARLARVRDGDDIPAVAGLERKLFPYQRVGVTRFLEQRRLLLADDMGLGKTAQAIAACHALWRSKRVARGLILVPASLKSQWKWEWDAFTDAPVTIVEGDAAARASLYRRTRRGFLIANYEQLLRDVEEVRRWAPQIVVLDEAQRIKNWSTLTARTVKTLDPEYRLVLTGTPLENRLEELASILDWVDDAALEPKWRLFPWHSAWGPDDTEVTGARNLEVLRTRMKHCLVRRVREEVLSQLPTRTNVRVPVEMTPEQTEEHDALRQPIASLMRTARKRPLLHGEFLRLMSLFTSQRLISNGMALERFEEVWPEISRSTRRDGAALRGLGSPKLLEFRERARELLEQGRKAVVFSQWRRMLLLAHWAIGDLLAKKSCRAAFFTGNEDLRRRTQSITEFHEDPHVPFLFATDAGGVGLNLQRAASCCINLELPWNPAVLEQRIGRIHRLGQDRPIEVYNLVCEEGIEARIAETLGGKHALLKGLFDGASDEILFEQKGGFLERARVLAGEELSVASTDADEPEFDDAPSAQVETPVSATTVPEPDARGPAVPGAELPLTEVRAAIALLEVRATPGGGLTIEAPPDAARVLAALLSGLAAKLELLA